MKKNNRLYLAGCIVIFSFISALPAKAQELAWLPFEQAVATADTSNLPILVEVWAPWCGWCRKMREEVYPSLSDRLSERYILTRINYDDHDTSYRYQGRLLTSFRLAQKMGAQMTPTLVFLTPDGDYLLHLSGYRDADSLNSILDTLELYLVAAHR